MYETHKGLRTAYLNGGRAFAAGLTLDANPYKKNVHRSYSGRGPSPFYNAWAKGFDEAAYVAVQRELELEGFEELPARRAAREQSQ